jgi:hypothetical protein
MVETFVSKIRKTSDCVPKTKFVKDVTYFSNWHDASSKRSRGKDPCCHDGTTRRLAKKRSRGSRWKKHFLDELEWFPMNWFCVCMSVCLLFGGCAKRGPREQTRMLLLFLLIHLGRRLGEGWIRSSRGWLARDGSFSTLDRSMRTPNRLNSYLDTQLSFDMSWPINRRTLLFYARSDRVIWILFWDVGTYLRHHPSWHPMIDVNTEWCKKWVHGKDW